MNGGFGVDDLANNFTGRMMPSMPDDAAKAPEAELEDGVDNEARVQDSILTTASQDEAQIVPVEDLHATPIFYAQG